MQLITLTTDFGLSDAYVAQMKGVIKSLDPEAEIIDLSHSVPAFDVFAAARLLADAAPQFPAETIHVVVVDPGVGSDRRRLLVKAEIDRPTEADGPSGISPGGLTRLGSQKITQYFIAPDNGIITLAAPRPTWKIVVSLDRPELFPQQRLARTFDGRNIFAPAAALLAKGRSPSELGTVLSQSTLEFPLVEMHYPEPRRIGDRFIEGEVIGFDHYGNAQTNLTRVELAGDSDDFVNSRKFYLIRELSKREHHKQELPLVEHFSMLEVGEVGVLFNSSGYLEIIANRESARVQLNLQLRARVLVETR